ncbi:UNVERIFIED_CONTAM: hypothetical protein FKN15_058694 [Acipenser sinensis]
MTERPARRFHNLTIEQVHTLDQVLTEVIPIHGRGNFPTLEVKPKDIIHVVKERLVEKEITVRDIRLNGSTASHVLVKENGTSYKDLDIIFGVELPKQEDFQIVKEVVLDCLLDFLPKCVNKDKITALTMKDAYVQKMVKVSTEHDRWSLISLSNNRGKNVELKFVNSMRRQFEFSVDSFQIILDHILESYQDSEREMAAMAKAKKLLEQIKETQTKDKELQAQDKTMPAQTQRSVDQAEELLVEAKASLAQDNQLTVQENEAPALNTETTSHGNESQDHCKETPAMCKATPAMSKETSTWGNKSPAQCKETPAMDMESPAQDKESPVMGKETPTQDIESPVQGKETPPLDMESPVQRKESSTKDKESLTPIKESQTPAKKSLNLAKESLTAAVESETMDKIAPAQDKESLTKIMALPAQVKDLLAESKESLAKNKESLALAKDLSSQTKECITMDKKSLNQGEALPAEPREVTTHAKALPGHAEALPVQEKELVAQTKALPVKVKDSSDELKDSSSQAKDLQVRAKVLPAWDKTLPVQDKDSAAQATESLAQNKELLSLTVVAESMYGDFEQAMDHLRYRLIATRKPEEIRGGGLLKYSNLLVREFKPACETEIKTLERYMCSRFFIDFPDVNEQQRKIESYLRNHFIGEEKSKYDYLMTLRRVINESTVCLMGHERRQTLNMITILALKVLGEQNIIPNTTNVTCYYQPAPYMSDHSFSNYYIAHGQPPIIYHPYPLHIHMQTGLV